MLLLILFIFLTRPSFAQKEVKLTDSISEYRVGKYTQVLLDSSHDLNIDSVASGSESIVFKALDSDETDFGHTKDAVWIRYTVTNNSRNNHNWILSEGFPIIDRVDLYIPASGGKFEVLTAGIDFPMSSRQLRSRKIIFPFSLKTGEQKTFYLRFQSRVMLPVYLRIWTPEAFAENQTKEYLIFGIFYGALLIMSFYNLLLFFFIKDKSFLYFSLYGLALCIYQTCVDGLFFRFISPDNTWIDTHIFIMMVGLVGFFFTLFVKEFIQVRKYSALLYNLLIATSAVFIFYALILSVVSVRFASSIAFLPIIGGNTIILIAAAYCLVKGDKNALIFLIAMLIFLAGIFFRHLNNIEYVHGTVGDELTLQIGFIGVFLAMTFLSFALGNRFNSIKVQEEREKALIRSRIASDLHDEIGSNLSSISLSSQMMKENPSLNLKEKKQLEDITLTAKETAQSIRDIIWFVDPENDKSEDLILNEKRGINAAYE